MPKFTSSRRSKTFTLRLTPEQLEALQQEARRAQVSEADLVRMALDAWCTAHADMRRVPIIGPTESGPWPPTGHK